MRIGVRHKVMAARRIGVRVDCSEIRPRTGCGQSIAGILGYSCLIRGSKGCHLFGNLRRVDIRICIRHECWQSRLRVLVRTSMMDYFG